MNLWCWACLMKEFRQDPWTFLRDEAQAAVTPVRWIWYTPVVFVNFVPPSTACSSYPEHLDEHFTLCTSLRFSFIGINWVFIPYRITSSTLAEVLKHLSAIDSVSLFICLGCQGWISGKLREWWNICSVNSFWKCEKHKDNSSWYHFFSRQLKLFVAIIWGISVCCVHFQLRFGLKPSKSSGMDLWPAACDGDTCCTLLHSAIDGIQGRVCADIAQSTGIKGESTLCFPVRHLTLQI